MNLTSSVAAEHTADLLRAAEEHRRSSAAATATETTSRAVVERAGTIALRPADPDEAAIVRRLAALDNTRELTGDVLLAIVDGEVVAALSLSDRRVVADPFLPTQDAVALLRLRADHLAGLKQRRRRIILRPRLA